MSPLDLAAFFVFVTSFLSLLLISLGFFNAHIAVLSGALVTSLLLRSSALPALSEIELKPHYFNIFILVLVSLLFRSDPYQYIAGGQDQGIYANMSKYFQEYGQIFVNDNLRIALPDVLQPIYDSNNAGLVFHGVYADDLNHSRYVFQFYHLHPVWMAIFAGLLGDDLRFYSTVVFSVLSILALYFIAFELTKNSWRSFFVALLIAINPLHAFFSKFPATEIVSLAFASFGVYYLLKYYNGSKERNYNIFFLASSTLAFGCMFFTRISGFMYIPIFLVILIVVELFCLDTKSKTQLRLYVYSIFTIYGASVAYGLIFSNPYSMEIYETSFSRILGPHWETLLAVFLTSIFSLCFLAVVFPKNSLREHAAEVLRLSSGLLPILFFIFTLLGAYKVYQLGFTEAYQGHPWYDGLWEKAGAGMQTFLHWSPIVLAEYFSPFLLVLFAYVLIRYNENLSVEFFLLTLFIFFVFAYICVLQWFIPYQYYYARYLLSEILPLMVLLTLTRLSMKDLRHPLCVSLLFLTVLQFSIFTTSQLRSKELDGFKESILELTSHIGRDDIVILDRPLIKLHDKTETPFEIKTSLRFYFDRNVISLGPRDHQAFVEHYCSQDRNIYLLRSGGGTDYSTLVKIFLVRAEVFEPSPHIPMATVNISKRLRLYRVLCDRVAEKKLRNELTIFTNKNHLGRLVNFHSDGVWTRDSSSISNIDFDVGENNVLLLRTHGWNPLRSKLDELALQVFANGKKLKMIKNADPDFFFQFDNIRILDELEIRSNTFTPSEYNINDDSRSLGLDINLIRLQKGIESKATNH